jgi:hypothetical protein
VPARNFFPAVYLFSGCSAAQRSRNDMKNCLFLHWHTGCSKLHRAKGEGMQIIKRVVTTARVAILISSAAGCFYYHRTDVDRPDPYYRR